MGHVLNTIEAQWDTTVASVAIGYTDACSNAGVLNTLSPHNPNRDASFLAVANAQEVSKNCFSAKGPCLGEDWASGIGPGTCPKYEESIYILLYFILLYISSK